MTRSVEDSGRCPMCGKTAKLRPRSAKLRYPHKCPHGVPCDQGMSLIGPHTFAPRHSRCSECAKQPDNAFREMLRLSRLWATQRATAKQMERFRSLERRLSVQGTPGPWSLVPDPHGWTIEANGQSVTAEAFDCTEADARQIAAAPELLAALCGLVKLYRIQPERHTKGPWRDALAAIAKASRTD